METRAHHVVIGLLTVIVVAAALLFGLWLAKSSNDRAFRDYQVVFNEAVTGLSQGAAVQYSGIKVGAVTQLKLDPADPRRVLATIRLSADTPVRQDTHARLALTGVTGLAIIQLSGGSPRSPPLHSRSGAPPVIVADPSPLTKLLANGEDILTNINEVVSRATLLLSDDNVAKIGRTLDHLDQATGAIAEQREDIRALLRQLAEASRTANATLAQAEELAKQGNALIGQQGRATLDSAQAAMASVQRATDSLDQLLRNNREALDGGMRGLSDLGPAVRDLRQTLGTLRGITRRLDDNPAGYLLGRDKTKEFQP
ncbi:MlaD family protein [Frateuria defendens]|uniref:MlaD family protein n=1 Tax=Frateuria defendens TaxID=2219559 RepID=UPI00066FD492|nr:MlaD family protein [Frateuria defendens]